MNIKPGGIKVTEYTREEILGSLARKFSPVGFASFFSLVTGMVLLDHHVRAINDIFDSMSDDDAIGIVIEMFRGAAKTTVENNVFGAWLVGQFPDKSGLIVQANDDIAANNSAKIATIIKDNIGWQIAFPHVVPDFDAGWGAKGYYVKQTHTNAGLEVPIEYSEWQRIRLTPHPSFIGVGYNSSSIIGKRPHWMIVDDINDEKNTRSERMLRQVKDILKGTIFPAANMAEVIVVIGTPWNESDAINYCLSTGLFRHAKIPVYTKGEPTWPEVFDEKKIQIERKKAGEIEFARMYLLDLEKTKGLTLKREWLFPYFDNTDIKKDWPAIAFIDYTSTENPEKEKSDFFCLAIAQIIPGNRQMVISDGVYKRLTRYDAQKVAVAKLMEYPNLVKVGVEAIFAGDEYHSVLEQNQELVDNGIIPEACRGGPWQRKKGHRFEYILADAFRRGTARLSDAESEFFTAFHEEWLGWQGDSLANMGHDDALDAVFGAVHLGLPFLVHGIAQKYSEIPTNPLYPRQETDEYLWVKGMTQ